MSATFIERYQQPIWGTIDRALRNCFVGSAILGVAILIAVFVAPTPVPDTVTMTDVPERLARLILERPKPIAPTIKVPDQVTVEAPKVEPKPEQNKPKPPPRRRTSKPKVAQDKGVQGRTKAQAEVTQNLAAVTGSLDKALDNLSTSLKTSDNGEAKPKSRRRRKVRTGRSTEQLASVQGMTDFSKADVSNSAISDEGISIAAITDIAVKDNSVANESSPAGASGTAVGRNDYRRNEALLGVVRRYAPGIQFCYDNELKKNPGLRGKMVVSMTVLANGKVSEVFVVDDTLRSASVKQCVLAQIRGWQFPAIPEGVVTFKTPFVFTPPK